MSDEATKKKSEMPAHGEICWTEIATKNLDTAKSFYTELFGWKIRGDKNPQFEYAHFEDGRDKDVGGMYQIDPEIMGHDVPPHFMTYVSVDDVDKTAARIQELGGKVMREPMDIPNTGRFAVVSDPDGAKFAIITLNEMS